MLRFLFILSRCCVVFRGGTLLEMLSLFYDIAQKLGQNSSPITVSQCDATQHWPSLWRKQYKNRQWQELQYPTVAPRVRQTFNLFSDLTSSWYQSLISLRSIQWESTPYQAIWLEHDLILSLLWWSIFSVIYWHESKAIKGTEKILPDYIMKEKGGGGEISNLLPQCSMTFPHTALQDSILRLPTMSKCLGRNKNQLTSSIFDLNIIKNTAVLLRSMIYPLRKTRQRQTRRTVNKDKDKPK